MSHQEFSFPESIRDQAAASLKGPDDKPVMSQRVRPVVRPVTQFKDPAEKQVKNETPPATPMASATAQSLTLPSRFFYYPFKDLYVEPFKVYHLGKLASAYENQSLQIMAETVSTVLSTPSGEKDLAFKLSVADFRAVLLWLRLNTFSKRRMAIPSFCNDPQHRADVEKGLKPAESLKITTVVTSTQTQTVELETAPDPEVYSVMIDGVAVRLRPETVADAIAFMDSPNWEDPEFQYNGRIAAALDLDLSFADRMALVDQLNPDDAALIYEYLAIVDAFGVKEFIETKCPECSASQLASLVVDAACFLPPKF